jgi:hypothetical protein
MPAHRRHRLNKSRMKLTKEQRQVAMLGAILAIIAVLLLYQFGSRFLPSPQGVLIVPPTPARLLLPPVPDESLFERKDYKKLKEVPNVPIRPMPVEGTRDPFAQKAVTPTN